jgi:hypothetical protein
MTTLPRDVACVSTLALLSTPAAWSEPFLVRNQHPMVALYGLPGPLPARVAAQGAGSLAATINWTSFEATDATGESSYTLDGEVLEARIHGDWAMASRVALHVELAHRSLSAGSLDGFIDEWHAVFGLPGGSRRKLPEDELLVEYRAGGTTLLSLDEDTSGIADIPVAVGYQLRASERTAIAGWFTVKLPTGSADDLTGSGATDVALSIAADTRPGERWKLFGQANLAWLGEGELLPAQQVEFAWSLLGGVTWNAWRGLDLTAQLEATSAVLDTGLSDLDGDAVVLTFGGSYLTQGGWRFDVGVVEDVEADASPDITFNFALRHAF